MKGRYKVVRMFVEHDGQVMEYADEAWSIPRNRVLQASTALRYLASGEGDDVGFVGNEINPALVFGMADAWALRQGLFRGDDSLT